MLTSFGMGTTFTALAPENLRIQEIKSLRISVQKFRKSSKSTNVSHEIKKKVA
jgi:hypothetical protein